MYNNTYERPRTQIEKCEHLARMKFENPIEKAQRERDERDQADPHRPLACRCIPFHGSPSFVRNSPAPCGAPRMMPDASSARDTRKERISKQGEVHQKRIHRRKCLMGGGVREVCLLHAPTKFRFCHSAASSQRRAVESSFEASRSAAHHGRGLRIWQVRADMRASMRPVQPMQTDSICQIEKAQVT